MKSNINKVNAYNNIEHISNVGIIRISGQIILQVEHVQQATDVSNRTVAFDANSWEHEFLVQSVKMLIQDFGAGKDEVREELRRLVDCDIFK
jgi:hypothetical protein